MATGRNVKDELIEIPDEELIVSSSPGLPDSATKLGLKRAMVEVGRWEQVRAMIASDPAIAEDWALAVEIRRDDPIFGAFVASGSFTNEDVDAVFRRAVEIVA